MAEAWSYALVQLTVEQALATRQVCQEWRQRFHSSLNQLCGCYDLHPCSTVKEFISALAHLRGWWRQVPSFSRLENKSFTVTSNFYKIMCKAFAVEESFPYSSSMLDGDDLSDSELLAKLSTISFVRGHTFLISICKVSRRRSPSTQYSVFRLLVEKGVPPYYLDLFLTYRLLGRRLTGSKYLSLIIKEQNEYLLKRELKASRTPAIPEDWQRGREIAAKYKKRHRRNYPR